MSLKILHIPLALILLSVSLFLLPADGFAEPSLRYSWNMDVDPGWTTEGLWAFGTPSGEGGQFGYPDPISGYTGDNVYGYNLFGDYEANLPEEHLTTTAIDCSGLTNVTLKFWRWLGVESSDFDHAYVRVSSDGSNWTTVEQNPVDEDVAENAWHFIEIDISGVADGQPTVYIRWTMGTTDSLFNFCGWNIDDVEIWAESAYSPPGVVTGSAIGVFSDSATLNGNVNPGGTETTVVFDYGTTLQYGNTVAALQNPLTGTTPQPVSARISGLDANVSYHFRVRATNLAGTVTGDDSSFLTPSKCPECSGEEVSLSNITFPSGLQCQCNATISIEIGDNVTVESGGGVTFRAPKVRVSEGFHAESGSTVRIKQ